VIPIGEEAIPKALAIALKLREKGVAVEVEVMGRVVSRALQDADRRKIEHAVILGPKELEEGKVILRDMKSRQQTAVDVEGLLKILVQQKKS
jgi:histidyl-tRNA synthetase